MDEIEKWILPPLFQRVEYLWQKVQNEAHDRPDLFGLAPNQFRVQQFRNMDWENIDCLPPIMNEWRYSGDTFNEETTWVVDKIEDFGEIRKAFYTIGRVQFHISTTQDRLGLTYTLGPRYGKGEVFIIERHANRLELKKTPEMEWRS